MQALEQNICEFSYRLKFQYSLLVSVGFFKMLNANKEDVVTRFYSLVNC